MKKYFGEKLNMGYLDFSITSDCQLDVCKYIRKNQSELIQVPGKLSRLDYKNLSKVTIFFHNPDLTQSFLYDKKSIYQIEGTQTFDMEKSCGVSLIIHLSYLNNNGFSVNTFSVSQFKSSKSGAYCTNNYSLNELTNKYVNQYFSPQEGVLKS